MKKKSENVLYLLWVHWLQEHAPKFVKYRFIRFYWLTGSDPKEVAKFILKLLF